MGALSRAEVGREIEDEWLARCRPRRGEEDLLAPLIEALRRLQRAQSVDDRMDRVDATLGCITEVERVLRVRLDVWLDANPERAKGAQKTAANKQSYEAFSRYRSERRRGLEERKLPSLHSIGYWFYGASRLEPAELRDELSVALGLRSGRDGDTGDELAEQAWLLGELRNALAHRGDYELGAPKRDPRLDELVVKTATGLDVKPGVQSLVRSVALRLHGYEGAFDTLTFTLEQRDGGPRASVVREQSSDERARDEGAQAQVSGVVTRRRKAPSTGSNDDGESVGWLAWAALGLGGLAVCVALAVLYLDHVRAAETTPAEPQPSASARASALASAISIPGDALAQARAVWARWYRALGARDRAALEGLYAQGDGALSWHATRLGASEAAATWLEHFAGGGAITADESSVRAEVEPVEQLQGTATACAQGLAPGGRVVRLRAQAAWEGMPTNAGVPCAELRGVYLVRVHEEREGWRICQEGWSLREAICTSCPRAPVCVGQR